MATMQVKVSSVREETSRIRRIELAAVSDAPLPAFEPGAHVRVETPTAGARAYSLVALAPEELTTPQRYRLGVLLEADSAGGSRFMHGLAPGDLLAIEAPRNDFALSASGPAPLLIAGGIGVTPLVSMATALLDAGRDFALHYAARTRPQFAFLTELAQACGEKLTLHCDDEPETRLDLAALLDAVSTDRPIFVCGPKGMIEAVREAALARGFPRESVRFELFENAGVGAGAGDAFEVEVKSTGRVVMVPADQTIIEALEAAGVDLVYDCQRGDCGICQTTVLEGEPDHRDVVLTDAEKAANDVMQICVSRSKSKRLVLDL